MVKRRDRELSVRRYKQSRLYDVWARQYVSVDDLRALRANGTHVVVREAETGQDVTDTVLDQDTRT